MTIFLKVLKVFLFVSLLIPPTSASQQSIGAPVLKWQNAGCYSSWCETGWYSSPAVADLNGDGQAEVIGGLYSLFWLNGADGSLIERIEVGSGRAWPSIVAADLDNDGDTEIVSAHGNGSLHVFDHNMDPVWSQRPSDKELRSLVVADLDNNGDLEILVASTRSYDQFYVYEHDGSLRAGDWPQHSPDSDTNGYTAGCFNQNVAAGDMDGDGLAEIIGTNDTHYTAAFFPDGSQMPANTLYGTLDGGIPKPWSRVGMHVDHAVDLRGYAQCGTEHRPNFAHSPPILANLDGSGSLEAVIVGNVYNCATSPYTSLYEMPFLFNKDRTRWSNASYDWTVLPTPDGAAAPLIEDYNVIESNHPNPVAADLDGDGNLEILYPSYDGRLHAYWLDKSEHGSWPINITAPGSDVLRFATEPAVADLDNNGYAEVIFATWVEKGSYQTGQLHIVDYLGNPIHAVDLPPAYGSPTWNGVLAAPTLANIDSDADLEVVLTSAHSGFLAYDLPGTSEARVLWGTGRGSLQRSGSIIGADLSKSLKYSSRPVSQPGETLTYTILLVNSGATGTAASLNDTLPAALTYAGDLSASSGSASYSAGVVTWSGSLPAFSEVLITYQASVDAGISSPTLVTNTVEIEDENGTLITRSGHTFVNGFAVYLPVIAR